ncbi:AraC family transcriptional regulator [Hydrocarboniphaga sp.]|uniref:AraC family transcriptional regulator n=1 Tax=Hydrocarboniphaga sp. TaxID=2033016 RepID=UPI003D0C6D86
MKPEATIETLSSAPFASSARSRLLAAMFAEGDTPPTLDEMARAAAPSPFHFHRIYRALLGETVAQTGARLRMSRAVHLLMEPSRPITAVAMSTGFATPQAFARAFRGFTGYSPSQARYADPQQFGAVLDPPLDAQGQPAPLAVRVVSLEPFEVRTLRHVGDHAGLFEVYDRLFGWAGEQDLLDRLRGLFGLPIDDPRDVPVFRFDAALAICGATPDAEGIGRSQLGGGRYLVARLQVSWEDGLEPLLDRLYLHALLRSGLAPGERPLHYEYLNHPEHMPEGDGQTDLYLAVR